MILSVSPKRGTPQENDLQSEAVELPMRGVLVLFSGGAQAFVSNACSKRLKTGLPSLVPHRCVVSGGGALAIMGARRTISFRCDILARCVGTSSWVGRPREFCTLARRNDTVQYQARAETPWKRIRKAKLWEACGVACGLDAGNVDSFLQTVHLP